MNKKLINLFFFFYIVLFNKTSVLSIENKIILKVDNKIITSIDIQNEAKYLKALNPSLKDLSKDKIFKIAKSSLVKEKIKEIEISKFKMNNITEEYFQEIIRSIYLNINIDNEDEFLNYLKSLNIEMSTIKNKFSIEAKWNQLIYNKFYAKLKVDKEQIKNEMLLNKKFLTSYLLYEIVYNIDENNDTKQIFQKIKKSIKENGFENTAALYSISESSRSGGKLGWVEENSISKKILKVLSNLNVGEYSKPVLIPGGFLILNIKDKKKVEKEINIEKETNQRIRSLQNQQLNQYSNIYFKKIKKNILIDEK
jgi:peptidyl-prolyl cis-trans isomerase SurA